MHLSLHPVTSDAEFKELVHCERISYETPYNAVFTLFCPVLTTRTDALAEAETRQRQWHQSDPSSHWIKVVDDDDDGETIVGAALWHIYEESPYAKPPEHEMTCYWWPEGPKRKMADQAMGQMMGPRVERMNKPHLLLEILFILPTHRRHGAATLLVQWGLTKADQLSLETFVESTDDGKPLYAKHGFKVMNEFELNVTVPPEREREQEQERTKEEREELLRVQRELYFRGWFMWRPVGGRFVEGETRVPWVDGA